MFCLGFARGRGKRRFLISDVSTDMLPASYGLLGPALVRTAGPLLHESSLLSISERDKIFAELITVRSKA
jgi:hypothetical protein